MFEQRYSDPITVTLIVTVHVCNDLLLFTMPNFSALKVSIGSWHESATGVDGLSAVFGAMQ